MSTRWLIYAASNEANPAAMARALCLAGCASAMHLDINRALKNRRTAFAWLPSGAGFLGVARPRRATRRPLWVGFRAAQAAPWRSFAMLHSLRMFHADPAVWAASPIFHPPTRRTLARPATALSQPKTSSTRFLHRWLARWPSSPPRARAMLRRRASAGGPCATGSRALGGVVGHDPRALDLQQERPGVVGAVGAEGPGAQLAAKAPLGSAQHPGRLHALGGPVGHGHGDAHHEAASVLDQQVHGGDEDSRPAVGLAR